MRTQGEDAEIAGAIAQPPPTQRSLRAVLCDSVCSANQGTTPIVSRWVKFEMPTFVNN